jgi:hypothetical protein
LHVAGASVGDFVGLADGLDDGAFVGLADGLDVGAGDARTSSSWYRQQVPSRLPSAAVSM